MRKKAFDIPSLDESLRRDYLAGKITAHEVALELNRANWTFYVVDDATALRRIGVSETKSSN